MNYRLKTIPETSSLVFCHTCVDVFEAKHRCPSVVVTRAELQLPSRLLAAKDSHSGEAVSFIGILELLHPKLGVIHRILGRFV